MKVGIVIVAFVALVWAAPVSAHLPYKRKDDSLSAIYKNQRRNLAHVEYVCKRGSGEHRKWSCAVLRQGWLARELRETEAAIYRVAYSTPPTWFVSGITCIYRYERGADGWQTNTGNGYYGGLQMDYTFQLTHGPSFLKRWGTADLWPVWAQIQAAWHGYRYQGGWSPWPKTRLRCGL